MSSSETKSRIFRIRWEKSRSLEPKESSLSTESCREMAEGAMESNVDDQAIAELLNRPRGELNVRELSDLWLALYGEVHKTTSSIIRDKQMLRDYIIPRFGEQIVNQIRPVDVVFYQSSLKKEGRLSNKSINLIFGLFHKVCEDGLNWEFCKVNPCKGVKMIRCLETEVNFWSFEERDYFLGFVKEEHPVLHEVIGLAVHTGLRRGEMEGLLRDCIDLDRREITVKRSYCLKTKKINEYTKGKNIRRVPMNDPVYEILHRKVHLQPGEKIFACNFHNLICKHFKPMQKRLGVPVIRFHDLRHTFASHLVMIGCTILEVKQMLGHSDINTTLRYAHLKPDSIKGKTDKLDKSKS